MEMRCRRHADIAARAADGRDYALTPPLRRRLAPSPIFDADRFYFRHIDYATPALSLAAAVICFYQVAAT
jgi:hypothetical protein